MWHFHAMAVPLLQHFTQTLSRFLFENSTRRSVIFLFFLFSREEKGCLEWSKAYFFLQNEYHGWDAALKPLLKRNKYFKRHQTLLTQVR